MAGDSSLRGATGMAWIAAILGGAACSHEWDAYDPLESTSTATGTGAAATSADGSGGSGGGAAASGSGAGAAVGGGGVGNAGAGGGGGGSAQRCNGTSVLTDDFTAPATTGAKFFMPAGTSVAAGEALAKLPTGGQGSWVGFSSKQFYDFRGDALTLEISQMVNTVTTAQVFLEIVYDEANFVSIFQQDGQITFAKYIDKLWVELASTMYDPIAHRWWRLRDDGAGMTFWETSPDGATWNAGAQWSTADLFPMDLVVAEFGAGTSGGEVAPGEAHFEGIRGMYAGQSHCPASSLTDDFDDGVRARAWENSWADVGCTTAEAGGEQVTTLAESTVAYCAYESAAAFDLTGDTVAVQVPSMVDTTTSAQAYFSLQGTSGAEVQFVQGSGQLAFRQVLDDTYTVLASVLYSPTTHLWWRFREEAGTIYWETSSDGVTWTIRADAAGFIDPSAVAVILGGGTWEPQSTPGAVHYDRYNLP